MLKILISLVNMFTKYKMRLHSFYNVKEVQGEVKLRCIICILCICDHQLNWVVCSRQVNGRPAARGSHIDMVYEVLCRNITAIGGFSSETMEHESKN